MRAIVSKGAKTASEVVDFTPLAAGAGEVVIDVRAIGVGRVDLIMQQVMPTDFVPGIEAAGIVTAVGADVDQQWIGRRVFARMQTGACADEVVASSTALVALPDDRIFLHCVGKNQRHFIEAFSSVVRPLNGSDVV